jgi:hypothetical protein
MPAQLALALALTPEPVELLIVDPIRPIKFFVTVQVGFR